MVDMKMKMRPFVGVCLVVGMMGVAVPASASVHAASPLSILKYCDYYSESGYCVDWYPNQWTCQNIWNRPHEDYQIAQCLAWLGYGSRGYHR